MNHQHLYKTLKVIFGLTWFVNGLICKVLNLVPRHQEIVAQILSQEFARPITLAIGLGEIAIALWILSGIYSRPAALLQIALVLKMNLLEYFIAPHLLLWGPLNSIFALLFIATVAWHEFWLKPRITNELS